MSALQCSATSSSVGTGTATTKTILLIKAPANTGIRIRSWEISFDGTSPTAGKALVQLVKNTTSGTGTGTTLTPVKLAGHTGSVQATAKENYSAEPSGGTVIRSVLVHTQMSYASPEDLVLNPGEELSLVTNVPAAVNARSSMRWEE